MLAGYLMPQTFVKSGSDLGKDVRRFSTAALIRGWFTAAPIFTCFTLGIFIGHQFFGDSRIPWLVGALAAMIINWGCYPDLRKLL